MGIALAGLAASAIGGILKMGRGRRQERMANRIKVPEVEYKASPYAQNILGEASRLKNSQMPGEAAATSNILENQASAMGGVNRNASSGSQALAMLAAIQGGTNQAFGTLQQGRGQHAMAMLQNWNNANQGMVAETDKEYQEKVRQQVMAIQQKMSLMGAAGQNFGGGMNDIINGVNMFVNRKMQQKYGKENGNENG